MLTWSFVHTTLWVIKCYHFGNGTKNGNPQTDKIMQAVVLHLQKTQTIVKSLRKKMYNQNTVKNVLIKGI